MKLIQSILTIFAISFFMTSCGDDGGLTLTLTSPNNDTVYTAGDVINIDGTATDDLEVVSLVFESEEINFNQTVSGNGTAVVPFSFEVELVDGTPAIENVTIKVTAIDSDGNSVSEERSITIE